MGREIRRVPLDWEHPRDDEGNYISMYDQDYESAMDEWLADLQSWSDGTHEALIDKPNLKDKIDFCGRNGSPPDKEYYRPKFESDPIGYQVYQNISKGTPISPVFETLEDMKGWLIGEGYSEFASQRFIEDGWAPSMAFTPSKGLSGIGIHSFDHLNST